MDDIDLYKLYAALTNEIAAMVRRVSGDIRSFESASTDEAKIIDVLQMASPVDFFYRHFAPSREVCGQEAVLLPISGIDWHTNKSRPGIHLCNFGYAVIATDYSGTPYCVDDSVADVPGPPVIAFSMEHDYAVATNDEIVEFARPIANSFMAFLGSFQE